MNRVTRVALALVAVLPVAGCAGSGEAQAPGADATPRVVRAVECRWAGAPIKVDGIVNEVAWDRAQVLEDFVVFWEKRKAKTATKARLLWDRTYLYFCAEMEDQDLYADVKEPNGMTWHNDVIELFFKPAADKLAYYEFQVNAANTPMELFLPSRGAGGYERFAATTRLGMESAVRLQGTLNHWQDRDSGWTVEGRIPWTAFEATGGRPKEGEKWRFALCRFDYSATLDRPEMSSTAPLTQADFHHYEDYGELVFVGLPR